MAIKRVCAWHKKYFGFDLVMGEIPGDEEGITHGMCEECYKKSTLDLSKKRRKPGSQKGAKP